MGGNLVWDRRKIKEQREVMRKVQRERSERSKKGKWDIPSHTEKITSDQLKTLYLSEGKSVRDIGSMLKCSPHKVEYWLEKYKIRRRTNAEALYKKSNPGGDPFILRKLNTPEEFMLFGLGVGLFFSKGSKVDRNSIRLGNTDPVLIKTFIRFLKGCYRVRAEDIQFGLQVFNDVNANDALAFWKGELGVGTKQFMKPVITRSRGKGMHKEKSRYGVLTVYFHNKKLRDVLMGEVNKLKIK